MSRMLLSSTEIDLIVHAIVDGPHGVEGWGASQQVDADALGSVLWARNWEAAARAEDGPAPEYRYTPPGVRLTALEGLRLLSYYAYQTADEDSRWRRGGLGTLLDSTTQSLISVLPGMAELPWVWSRADLDARRVEPVEVPAPDPRIAELVRRYADAGIELTHKSGPLPFRIGSDLPVLGWWTYHPPGYLGMPAIMVFLADDDATAAHLVTMVRSLFSGVRPNRAQGMMRRGREVVAFDWMSRAGTDRGEQVWEQVAGIGALDERWHSDDPPPFEGGGEVLATRVDVPSARLGNGDTFLVARTPADLAALADEIADPEVRDRILRVDTRRQSVITLPQLPDVEEVRAVRSDELVVDTLGYESLHTLSIELGGARRRLMSVIAVDRLPQVPDRALVTEGGTPVTGQSVRGVRADR